MSQTLNGATPPPPAAAPPMPPVPSGGGATPLSALAALGPPQGGDDEDRETIDADETAASMEEKPGKALEDKLRRWARATNIADELDSSECATLAGIVKREFEIDDTSRSEYLEKYKKWLDFAMQAVQEKTYPWPRASNVVYPLLTSAAIQFAARAYPSIVRDSGVVKGEVVGEDKGEPTPDPATGGQLQIQGQPQWITKPGEKRQRADLVGRHMSWQLLTEQEEWEPQTDRMLVVLPIVGSMFRKSMFDPNLRRNVSETIDATHLVVNYHARSFETAPRKSEIIELYPWEIEERIRSGIFLDEEFGTDIDQKDGTDTDSPVTFIEQHRRYDLDDDGYAEPYIVTISRDSMKMARIRAGYEMAGVEWTDKGTIRRIAQVEYYTKYGFIPSPGSNVYDLGFGHLLYPINEAINTSLNQMFDAGHLQNVGGGFIGSGISLNTGAVRFQVGEYKPVNTMGGTLKDNIFPLPFPGPSQVLFALVQFLVEAGKEIAAVKDIMVGDMPGDNTSGITTLAVIEQGLKVYSAIHKRIHRSLSYEFRKLFRLNRLYLPKESGWLDGDTWRNITREDYGRSAGVAPVSDPQMVTDMQRMGRAQFLLQFKDDPLFNGREIRIRMLEAANIPDADMLLVQQPPPEDPKWQLKGRELDIRQAKETADLMLRQHHDKAMMVREIAQAELFLAQARKLDNDAQLGWVEQHLNRLKLQVDAAFGAADSAAGGDDGSPAPGPGADVPPIPGMAPPPNNPHAVAGLSASMAPGAGPTGP
jgi:chaperonin GroES